jgi:hypothetical protein
LIATGREIACHDNGGGAFDGGAKDFLSPVVLEDVINGKFLFFHEGDVDEFSVVVGAGGMDRWELSGEGRE